MHSFIQSISIVYCPGPGCQLQRREGRLCSQGAPQGSEPGVHQAPVELLNKCRNRPRPRPQDVRRKVLLNGQGRMNFLLPGLGFLIWRWRTAACSCRVIGGWATSFSPACSPTQNPCQCKCSLTLAGVLASSRFPELRK